MKFVYIEHMIKGLDDDEVEFLDLVDRSKLEEERKKSIEEEREMADFRNKVATLQEQSLEQRIQQEIKVKPPLPSLHRLYKHCFILYTLLYYYISPIDIII